MNELLLNFLVLCIDVKPTQTVSNVLFFTEINDPVVVEGLPLSLSVTENVATGTLVYTVSYSDQDTTQSHTYSMTSSPASGLTYFAIDNSMFYKFLFISRGLTHVSSK